MPFKPNYNFQKLERERAKAAKKEERLRRKQADQSSASDGSTDGSIDGAADAPEAATDAPAAGPETKD